MSQLVQVSGQCGLKLSQDAGSVFLQFLSSHGQVGLLQLDPGLLDVVHHGAGLQINGRITMIAKLGRVILNCTCFSSLTIFGKSLFKRSA